MATTSKNQPSKRVFITAGHTVIKGKGSGASGYIDEAKENIRMRDKIIGVLKTRGITAWTDDDTASLATVINQVSHAAQANDLLIDIHFNASAQELANGTEVIIPDAYSKVEMEQAEKLLQVITGTLGTRSRGVIQEGKTPHKILGILHYPHLQNILIEICFVSSKNDVAKYEPKRDALAEAIAQVIETYIKTA